MGAMTPLCDGEAVARIGHPAMLEFLKMAEQKSTRLGAVKSGAKDAARQLLEDGRYPPRPAARPPEMVDPRWVVKALALAVAAALALGYGTWCMLFHQGQGQLVLHPKRTATVPAAIAGASVETIRFGPDDTGKPQRVGWMIPAAGGGKYAGITVLYLPPGDGSLVDSVPTLGLLHGLGVRVFAFDYRGYGQSAAMSPSEARMRQDADAAFAYLTGTRMVQEDQIVPYGAGVGASLAAYLAQEHRGMRAMVVDSPGPDPLATVLANPRTKLLPVRWLFHERFALAGPLAGLTTPKLLISAEDDDGRLRGAADPKVMVFAMPVPSNPESGAKRMEWLTRFFDQYVAGMQTKQLQFGVQGSVQ